MYNFFNSSTIYVSQRSGDDNLYSGLAPYADEYGNGPFRTLDRAIESVGERRVCGFMRPMTIALVDDYYLTKPVSFNCDSNVHAKNLRVNAITIESYKGRKKIVGGIKITDWKNDTFNGVECISATLPKRSDGKEWDCTDLFINGVRAANTRYPASDTLKAVKTENDFPDIGSTPLFAPSKWFIAYKDDLKNVDEIENATVNFYHYWIDEHSAIESYDRETGKLTMKYQSRFTISSIYAPEEHTSALKYFLENIPSMFKNKNEWYFNRKNGKIYYIPECADIDLDSIEAYAPTTDKLFDICGDSNSKIKDIRFRNLELLCTRSDYVSKYVKNPETGEYEVMSDSEEGFASDIQSVCYAHGAVSFKYADRCSVENCLIHHIGTHAVEVREGCCDIRIENNIFDDLGAGAVRIFGGCAKDDSSDITENCIIRKNKITNCGKKLAAACGILVCHSAGNEISENEIAYLDYSGISVGWVWGYFPSSTYGNIIKNNHIHHIGQGRLSDMGGIYLLGQQEGTIVSGNRIHDVSSAHYGGWGIYTDEGSSYITIENNVVYNTKCESLHQHYGSYNIVRNNIFAFGSACVRVSKNEMHDCMAFENNIFVVDGYPVYMNRNNMNNINAKRNIIFNLSDCEPVMFEASKGNMQIGFEKWTKTVGMDVGSVLLNPLFKDIKHFDFTLCSESPAIDFGFNPIDGFTASGKE